MQISKAVSTLIETAAAKALASDGPAGLNVVPISMVKVNDDSIWLFDFFMYKTRTNIETSPSVALTAWTDMTGVQIRASVTYLIAGDEFNEAVEWCQTQNPERVVKGLLVLSPIDVFDISPGGEFTAEELTISED